VTERTPWRGGYVGINSFGFGGSNVHVLLRSADDIGTASSRRAHIAASATRLVTCAGRTKTGVEAILAELSQHPTDVDLQCLVQSSVCDLPPSTHPYRGTALLNSTDSRQTVQVLMPSFFHYARKQHEKYKTHCALHIGVASYGALGHVPPSTSSIVIL